MVFRWSDAAISSIGALFGLGWCLWYATIRLHVSQRHFTTGALAFIALAICFGGLSFLVPYFYASDLVPLPGKTLGEALGIVFGLIALLLTIPAVSAIWSITSNDAT